MNRNQFVAAEWCRTELVRRGDARDNRHVQIITSDTLTNVVEHANLELQIEGRVFRAVLRQQPWHQIQPRRGAGAETDATHGAARDAVHPFAGAIDGRENTPRFLEHDLARDSQRHTPRGPIQQLRADLLLELRDLVRHRRLRHIANAGSSGEMTELGDGHERLQMGKIHR